MTQLILVVPPNYYWLWILLSSPSSNQQYQAGHVETLIDNMNVSCKLYSICHLFLVGTLRSVIINGAAPLCLFPFGSYALSAPCEFFLPPGLHIPDDF